MSYCETEARLRLRNLESGVELPWVYDYSYCIPRPFYVRRSTTIKDIFTAVSFAVAAGHPNPWPLEYIKLMIGNNLYECPVNLKLQKQKGVDQKVHKVVGDQQDEVVVSYHCMMPEDFSRCGGGYCLCSFGGCCRLCNVPGTSVCPSCGNNGCCRCQNCGCECCSECFHANELSRDLRRCPILGCRPRWASDQP